jgi:hypothetical protein
MNKLMGLFLIGTITLFGSQKYTGSTTAAVTLSGGVIKAQNVNIDKKYPRKECPVCKGKGWYMSGDGISKVDCGYCEPESKIESQKVIVHPPAVIKESCPDGICRPQIKVK